MRAGSGGSGGSVDARQPLAVPRQQQPGSDAAVIDVAATGQPQPPPPTTTTTPGGTTTAVGSAGTASARDPFAVDDTASDLYRDMHDGLPPALATAFHAPPCACGRMTTTSCYGCCCSGVWLWVVGINCVALALVVATLCVPFANPFAAPDDGTDTGVTDDSDDGSHSRYGSSALARSLRRHWVYVLVLPLTATCAMPAVVNNMTLALAHTQRDWHADDTQHGPCAGCCDGCGPFDRQCRTNFLLMPFVYASAVVFWLILLPYTGFFRWSGLAQYGAGLLTVQCYCAVVLPTAFRASRTHLQLNLANALAVSALPLLVLFLVAFDTVTSPLQQNALMLALAAGVMVYRNAVGSAFRNASAYALRLVIPSVFLVSLTQSFAYMALPRVTAVGTLALVYAIHLAGALTQPLMLTAWFWRFKRRFDAWAWAACRRGCVVSCCTCTYCRACCCSATAAAVADDDSDGCCGGCGCGCGDGASTTTKVIPLTPTPRGASAGHHTATATDLDAAAAAVDASSHDDGEGESLYAHRVRYAAFAWLSTAGHLLAALNYVVIACVVMRFGPNARYFPLHRDVISDSSFHTSIAFAGLQALTACAELLAFRCIVRRMTTPAVRHGARDGGGDGGGHGAGAGGGAGGAGGGVIDPEQAAYAVVRALRWQFPHMIFTIAVFVPFIVLRHTRLIA